MSARYSKTPPQEGSVIMKAQEVHAILIEVLGPEMRRLGFRRLSGPAAGWYRAENPVYLLVYSHISWTGFDDNYGSWFSLEFAYASSTRKNSILKTVFSHSPLLTASQKDDLTKVEDEARADIPVFKPSGEYHGELRYYNSRHVRDYAAILAEAMESMLTTLKKSD